MTSIVTTGGWSTPIAIGRLLDMTEHRLSKGAATVAAGAMLAFSATAFADSKSTLYYHATVFSGRSEQPDATWFTVENGRVTDVGSGDAPERWRDAQRVDLGGRFVMPGFVDAHVHFVEGGLGLIQEDLADVVSADAARRAVARAAQRSACAVIVVRNPRLGVIGNQPPTHDRIAPIAAVAGTRPTLVTLKGRPPVYAT